MQIIPSYISGSWVSGSGEGVELFHAVHGSSLGAVSSKGIDFASALHYGRAVGGPALRAMTFHARAMMLKKLALYLGERKEELYIASKPTGATRNDSWIDIEGGIGTFFVYSSKARREFPNETFLVEGTMERLSKNNTFAGQHLCVPLEGVAIHINAFNFPCWGMLEKLAPTFLGGMPAIVKPASASCFLTQAMVKLMLESGMLPDGALQLVCGSLGDTFDHLTCQDVVTFTGSQATGMSLKQHGKIVSESVRFNMESDSLNCSVLGPDALPGTEEFGLYVKELVREMSVKAGQKCTVIRRAIVPRKIEAAVIDAVKVKLAAIMIGDPDLDEVRMGPLVNRAQADDVRACVQALRQSCELAAGDLNSFSIKGAENSVGTFLPPLLLYCKDGFQSPKVHSLEAFGPVSTVMGYDSVEEAIALARMGNGSLVGSLFTGDDEVAKQIAFGLAPYHGRLLLADASTAKESTGHGSPMPHMVHGGPGRAGGGEELGGLRSVHHYLQRVGLQGSPTRLSRIVRTWLPGAARSSDAVHPFRKHLEELVIGESFETAERTITEADVNSFSQLSGDHFYVHTDEEAAKASLFGRRVAHGYFVLSAAAGLFVDPAPGPMLLNYGLENLRFVRPVYFDDRIKVKLTCKQKTPREGEPQGVVHWDVEITNQDNETVAVYTLLTLVKRLKH